MTLDARGDDDPIGSLNVYNHRTGAFDATDIEIAQLIAWEATQSLMLSGKLARMGRALTTRTSIGQAQGILMIQSGINPDQASNVLRRYSQHENRPLRDVAAEVVRSRGLSVTN